MFRITHRPYIMQDWSEACADTKSFTVVGIHGFFFGGSCWNVKRLSVRFVELHIEGLFLHVLLRLDVVTAVRQYSFQRMLYVVRITQIFWQQRSVMTVVAISVVIA